MDRVRLDGKIIEDGREAATHLVYRHQLQTRQLPPGTVELFASMLAKAADDWNTWRSLTSPASLGLRLDAAIQSASWCVAAGNMITHTDQRNGIIALSLLLLQSGSAHLTPAANKLVTQMQNLLSLMSDMVEGLRQHVSHSSDTAPDVVHAERITLAKQAELAVIVCDMAIKIVEALKGSDKGNSTRLGWHDRRRLALEAFAGAIRAVATSDAEVS